MKLAVFMETCLPGWGGASGVWTHTLRRLADEGHHITLCAGRAVGVPEHERLNIRTPSFVDPRKNTALQLIRLARWFNTHRHAGRYDATISATCIAPGDLLAPHDPLTACILPLMPPRPRLKLRLRARLEARALHSESIRKVLLPSQRTVNQLVERFPKLSDRTELLPPAVAPPTPDKPQARAALRQAFDIPEDAVVFTFPAMRPVLKGIAPTLQAFRSLLDAGDALAERAVLVLVGGATYPQWAHLASLGLRDRVRWMGLTQRLPQVLHASDVVLLPAIESALSEGALEARILNKPIVVSGQDGVSEWLDTDDPAVAIVQDPTDAQAIAEHARRLTTVTPKTPTGWPIEDRLNALTRVLESL